MARSTFKEVTYGRRGCRLINFENEGTKYDVMKKKKILEEKAVSGRDNEVA